MPGTGPRRRSAALPSSRPGPSPPGSPRPAARTRASRPRPPGPWPSCSPALSPARRSPGQPSSGAAAPRPERLPHRGDPLHRRAARRRPRPSPGRVGRGETRHAGAGHRRLHPQLDRRPPARRPPVPAPQDRHRPRLPPQRPPGPGAVVRPLRSPARSHRRRRRRGDHRAARTQAPPGPGSAAVPDAALQEERPDLADPAARIRSAPRPETIILPAPGLPDQRRDRSRRDPGRPARARPGRRPRPAPRGHPAPRPRRRRPRRPKCTIAGHYSRPLDDLTPPASSANGSTGAASAGPGRPAPTC